MTVLKFILDNILQNPPILLGLIAMLGLILQKKSFAEVIKGTLMTSFGMFILTEGVNILAGTIAPLNSAVQAEMGLDVGEGLSDVTFTENYGGIVGLAMFIGLIIHILIARFTKFKTIFLTGHMLWWFPFVIVAGGVQAGLEGPLLIIISAILSALYWSIMPWIMRKYVWDVTGDENFLIGHPTGILSLLSGFIAKKVGDKSKSTEDVNVPKSLSFFKEISITGGMVIFLIYIVIGIITSTLVPEGENLFFFSLGAGLKFGAGLLIMLYGVRLLISQIVPAFQGISSKLIPGAKPAFDVPIIFNYKPNAAIIGFVVAMITSTILIIILNSFNIFGITLLPLVITCFFECGGAAVIGEGQGGLRGCIVGTVFASILMVVLVGISASISSTTIQNWMLIFGGNDLSLMEIISNLISSIF